MIFCRTRLVAAIQETFYVQAVRNRNLLVVRPKLGILGRSGECEERPRYKREKKADSHIRSLNEGVACPKIGASIKRFKIFIW
jgi:hypothetical protein